MRQRDVQTKIDVIRDNLDKLQSLGKLPYTDFASDFRSVDSALHRLQTSIQALLDIGGYIVAALRLKSRSIFRHRVPRPRQSRWAIRFLMFNEFKDVRL